MGLEFYNSTLEVFSTGGLSFKMLEYCDRKSTWPLKVSK